MHRSQFGIWKAKAFTSLLELWNHTPGGRRLKVSTYEIRSERIPEGFDGFRIVQLSDLHGRTFGKEQKRLVDAISPLKPDILVMTGDLVREFYEEKERAAVLQFCQELPKIAPMYGILGNHEKRSEALAQILADLYASPVELLRDEGILLTRGHDRMMLYGLETGKSCRNHVSRDDQTRVRQVLHSLFSEKTMEASAPPYRVLLAHKPEDLPVYAECGADLVLAGHAHGGFMNLGRRRLYAPGQGFFPKLTHGLYHEVQTDMIVSAGLGGPRVWIPPEIVCVDLKRK